MKVLSLNVDKALLSESVTVLQLLVFQRFIKILGRAL